MEIQERSQLFSKDFKKLILKKTETITPSVKNINQNEALKAKTCHEETKQMFDKDKAIEKFSNSKKESKIKQNSNVKKSNEIKQKKDSDSSQDQTETSSNAKDQKTCSTSNHYNKFKKSKKAKKKKKQPRFQIKVFKNTIDVSESVVNQQETKDQENAQSTNQLKIESSKKVFDQLIVPFKKNSNFGFASIPKQFLTRNTFVKFSHHNIFVVANDGNHPEYKATNNSICVYSQDYDFESKGLQFNKIWEQKVNLPVTKMLVNQEDDLLFVGFIDNTIKVFYIDQLLRDVSSNAKKAPICLEEITGTGLDKKSFSVSSMTLVQAKPHQIRLKNKNNKKFLTKSDEMPFHLNKEEYLLIFNEESYSLEYYNIRDVDEIHFCLGYKLRNLPLISHITLLENDFICLGSKSNVKYNQERGLVLMNLKNFEYSFYGWKQLQGVHSMVYDQENEFLFVSNLNRYFSVFKIDLKNAILELAGHYSIQGLRDDRLTFSIIESRTKEKANKLFVFDGTDSMFMYLIGKQGKTFFFSKCQKLY